MKTLWSIRALWPWLFRRWERRTRRELERRAPGSLRAPLAAGSRAPSFKLPDETGRPRRSEEWIGRGTAVVWLTNLCGICARQARDLAVAAERGELTAAILAIHYPGGLAPSPAEFLRRTGARFPILVDDGTVSRLWSGEVAPDT